MDSPTKAYYEMLHAHLDSLRAEMEGGVAPTTKRMAEELDAVLVKQINDLEKGDRGPCDSCAWAIFFGPDSNDGACGIDFGYMPKCFIEARTTKIRRNDPTTCLTYRPK